MPLICSSSSALPHFSSEYKYPRTVITNLCACTYTHSNTRTGHWLRDSDVHLHCWATSPLADAQCAPILGLLPRLLPKEICPGIHLHSHIQTRVQKRKVTVQYELRWYGECIYIRTFLLVLFYITCLTFVLHLVLVFYTCYQHHYIYLPRFRFTNGGA